MGCTSMDEQMAIQEAAAAGMRSMEQLVFQISASSHQTQNHPLDCREITDFTVSKFNKVISILNRTGHARFRRGQTASSCSSSHHSASPTLSLASAPLQSLTLDFTKAEAGKEGFCVSPQMSSANSSFLSSVTGDGSVSNGKQGSSLLALTPIAAATSVPAVKPPVSSSPKKIKCHSRDHPGDVSGKHGRCHCSKRRKSRVKTTIRVPAISSRMANIPSDEYSWRKYGQKPIKGSPYPRGYYKCSTVRGCPARKHVERATDDPTMLIVTYENEHRHTPTAASPPPEVAAASGRLVFGSA